jgi:1-acyl-sn-glycerol-3-phosphate acyltransferase
VCLCLQDIYSLFHLQRPFKFISKTSNFLIPIVGWSMFLTGAQQQQQQQQRRRQQERRQQRRQDVQA